MSRYQLSHDLHGAARLSPDSRLRRPVDDIAGRAVDALMIVRRDV
jgi:hypothetical protein